MTHETCNLNDNVYNDVFNLLKSNIFIKNKNKQIYNITPYMYIFTKHAQPIVSFNNIFI